MAADKLMAQLLKIALDEEQPVVARLSAIRDGLDRAGLAARQQVDLDIELGAKQSVWDRIVLASTTPVSEWDPQWEDDLNGSAGSRVIDAEIVEVITADPDVTKRDLEEDERTIARDRLMEKRRRSGVQRALPPAEAARFARRKPKVDIEEDPRHRPEQPPSSRAEQRREYESELLRREAVKPQRHKRRTQRAPRQDEI
jgi:hypothetical protein